MKKVKAFYQKHETSINLAGISMLSVTLYAVSTALLAKSMEPKDEGMTDEDWDAIMEHARAMDEITANAKARHNQK